MKANIKIQCNRESKCGNGDVFIMLELEVLPRVGEWVLIPLEQLENLNSIARGNNIIAEEYFPEWFGYGAQEFSNKLQNKDNPSVLDFSEAMVVTCVQHLLYKVGEYKIDIILGKEGWEKD